MSDAAGFSAQDKRLFKVAIIGGLLCTLLGVGYLTNKSIMFPVLLLITGVAPIGIYLLLRHIELGLIAMLLSAVFMRFRLPTGTASEIVVNLLLCGAILGIWLVHMVTVEKRIKLKPALTNLPLLAFIGAVLISMVWSRVYRDVLVISLGSSFVSLAAMAVMVLLPITFLLVANLVDDIRWMRVIVWLFLVEGLVSLVITLIIDLRIGPSVTLWRLVFQNGFLWINHHGLYSMWYVSFASSLALFNHQLRRALRVALLIYTAGWVYWGFVLRSAWLSGWVPAFVVMIAISFLRSKRLFIILSLVVVIGAGGYYWRVEFQRESEVSGVTRLAAYEVNWRITGKHLLFGTGPAGYASYYMSYFPSDAMASHNNYIDILAQTGIVGFASILWFFAAQVWGGYKLRLKLQGRNDFAESLSVAVVSGTVGCIVATALGDWLLPFAYTQGIVGFDSALLNWFFMGLLWALSYALASEGLAPTKPYGIERTTL